MKTRHTTLALAAAVWCSLASTSAFAAGRGADSAYQAERAACLSGRSHQDQATCLKEAGAARAEARRGGLTTPNADYMANALQRCNALPDADRADCKARVAGYGSQSGSVEGGGIYRETVTRSVQTPPPAMSGSGTAPQPGPVNGTVSGTPAGSSPGTSAPAPMTPQPVTPQPAMPQQVTPPPLTPPPALPPQAPPTVR